MIWLIQLRAGLPARPSRHFVILQESEHGKVQEVSPKGTDLQKETAKRHELQCYQKKTYWRRILLDADAPNN